MGSGEGVFKFFEKLNVIFTEVIWESLADEIKEPCTVFLNMIFLNSNFSRCPLQDPIRQPVIFLSLVFTCYGFKSFQEINEILDYRDSQKHIGDIP